MTPSHRKGNVRTAATPKVSLSSMYFAAPWYAAAPTPSMANDSAANERGSVYGLSARRVSPARTAVHTRRDSQAVLARLGRVGAEGGLEGGDVGRLVHADLREAGADPVGEARGAEGVRVVRRERPRVERVLEVLERERELQDVRLCARARRQRASGVGRGEGLTVGRGGGRTAREGGGGDEGGEGLGEHGCAKECGGGGGGRGGARGGG